MNVVKEISRHDMLESGKALAKVITVAEELRGAQENYSARGLLSLKHLYKFEGWRDLDTDYTVPAILKLVAEFGLAYIIRDSLYVPSALSQDG
jgi:hypothetical protein